MSSTTTNTNTNTNTDAGTALEDKRLASQSDKDPDYRAFALQFLSSLFFTILCGVFLLGGLGLFCTKVAQANVLPANADLAPFTVRDRIVKELPIDLHIWKPSWTAAGAECLSQKAVFRTQAFVDSFAGNPLLCGLARAAQPDAGMWNNGALYFHEVYSRVMAANFGAVQSVFLALAALPESMVMVVYPLVGPLIWAGLYLFNVATAVLYHLTCVPQLFRATEDAPTHNKQTQGPEQQWQPERDIHFMHPVKALLFGLVWFWLALWSTLLTPALFTLQGLLAPLWATYAIRSTERATSNQEEPRSVFSFLQDLLVYKQSLLFVLASLSMVVQGSRYLGGGSLAMVGLLLAIAVAYFAGVYGSARPSAEAFTPHIRAAVKQAKVLANTTQWVNLCADPNQPVAPLLQTEALANLVLHGARRPLTHGK